MLGISHIKVSSGSIRGETAAQSASALARSAWLMNPPLTSVPNSIRLSAYTICACVYMREARGDLLGHIGSLTRGLIIGSFFTSSVLSMDLARSCRRLMLEPPNLAAEAASETSSEAFRRLPLLMRREACGEKPVPSGSSTLTAFCTIGLGVRLSFFVVLFGGVVVMGLVMNLLVSEFFPFLI